MRNLTFAIVGLLCAPALAQPFDANKGTFPNAEDYISGDGTVQGDMCLPDDKMVSWGNTCLLPDYWCEYVSASTAYICTNQTGEVYRVTDGGVAVAFAGNVSGSELIASSSVSTGFAFKSSSTLGATPLFWPNLTNQTPDTGMFSTGTLANSVLVCEYADKDFDFALALQEHPTLSIKSKNQATDEALNLRYDSMWSPAQATDAATEPLTISTQPPNSAPDAVEDDGANLVLAPSQGRELITIVDFSTSAGATLTVTVCSAGSCAVPVVLTADTTWACSATSNAVCALALYDYLIANPITGMLPVCSDATCSDGLLAANVVPGTSDTVTVASSHASMAVSSGTDGSVSIPSGTAANGGLCFSEDPDTCIFLQADGFMAFGSGGSRRFQIGSNITMYVGMNANSNLIRDSTGPLNLGATATTSIGALTGSSIFGVDANGLSIEVTGDIVQTAGAVKTAPQTITCADSGDGAQSACGGAQTITSNVVQLVCNDTDGCDLTLAETNWSATVTGDFTMHGPAANHVDVADDPGVTELTGGIAFVMATGDTMQFSYSPLLFWSENTRSAK